MGPLQSLASIAVNHDVLVYGLIFISSVVQGQLIALACGFLARFGYLYIVFAAMAVIAGDLVGDVIIYHLGKRWGEPFAETWGKYVGITDKSIKSVRRIFEKHHRNILIGSKLTNGFGLAIVVLFTAGMMRVPFWRYMTINFLGECVWTAAVVAVGYFYGQLYTTIDNISWRVGIVIFGVILLFILVRVGIYIRKTLLERL